MRKRLFVKPKLQMTHLVWILGGVTLSSVLSYVLFESLAAQAMLVNIIDPDAWIVVRNTLRVGFAIILLVVLGVIGIESYFFFHRIVGPIVALEKGMKRLANLEFDDEIHLRESDELGEVIAQFEEVKKKLRSQMKTYEEQVQSLTRELDNVLAHATPENLESLHKKLKDIRDQVVKKAA